MELRKETITCSPAETHRLGVELASALQPGALVAFRGDLGSGKTCMIQGICQALKVEDYVTSPTFILINEYGGQFNGEPLPVYHFDLYRLSGEDDLEALGAEEYFYGVGICLVEWAERAGDLLPAKRVEVEFEYLGDDERRIVISRLEP
ncbi:MAG: tRNA threonylcarbamoyladenosine biosynthesis protein TsaE [Candidatus Latescibacterota bacterium]|jgi:tRNA threonylcarbamoyladenosine biosynthesis protein TsaE